jgi:c-di-GMP-binding flagellar brake protein YcgR
MDGSIMLEQRKHKRININNETRALAWDKIAKVVDISKGGLSLMFLDDINSSITGELSLDLLCNEKDLDTRQIPGKIVWNKEVSYSSKPGMVYKKVGIQFGDLSVTQKKQLKNLFFN